MNKNTAPTDRQQAYLRYLAACAHEAGLPYLPTASLTQADTAAWIEYLHVVIAAHERVEAILHDAACPATERSAPAPYFITPPRDQLPSSYRPPWQDLPDADDHEHIVGSIIREDGLEETVCVLCGASG